MCAMNHYFGPLLFSLIQIMGLPAYAANPEAPYFLRTDYTENPLGMTNQKPVFSWLMKDGDRGERQTAYQIMVASTPEKLSRNEADVWNTGLVYTDQQNGVVYNGKPLAGKAIYYWKVRLQDKDKNGSPYSNAATFETSLLRAQDWAAAWIYVEDNLPKSFFDSTTVNYKDSTVHPLYERKNWEGNTWLNLVTGKLVRKEFTLPAKAIRRARAYVANLGYYELRINGKKAGDGVLNPGMTDCSRRVLSVTHDVKSLLQPGQNAVGVMLSTGRLMNCKDGFRFQLEIEFDDRQTLTVLSDESWKGTLDAHFKSVTNWGISKERIDATREQPGWDKAGFNEEGWKEVRTANLNLKIDAQREAIRVIELIQPVQTIKVSDSVYRYNMGQNFSGWARIKVKGPRGKIITVQYADGEGSAMDFNQQNQYVLKGEGVETLQPRFTYHGFQWVTVTGYPGVPGAESVQGCVVHTDLQQAGEFTCSDELLNRLYENSRWSLRTNVHSVYTDCPSREKVPWLGQWSQETLSQHFDMGKFFLKWTDDLAAAQEANGRIADKVPGRIHYGWNGTDPVWVSEVVLGTWDIFQAYGDVHQLSQSYPVLQRLIEYYQSIANKDFIITESKWGDHIGLDKPAPAFLSTAYFYRMVKLMASVAAVLNKHEDRADYQALSEKIKAGFNAKFLHHQAYDNNSQGANAVALHFGIAPDSVMPVVLKNLEEAIAQKSYHVSTGGATTYNLMNALWQYNKTALAYQLATQKTFPAWGFWVENGATTSWEQWEIKKTSKNHGWLGAYLASWMVKAIGGISCLEPGYKKIRMVPGLAGSLTYATSSLQTVRGTVSFSWKKTSAATLAMVVTVPPNSTADVYIPATDALTIRQDKRIVWTKADAKNGRDAVVLAGGTERFIRKSVGSGTYHFLVANKTD